MSLALSDNLPRLESVLSLNIQLPTTLMHIKAQIIVAESEKEISRQPGEEITAQVVRRSQKAYHT
jgi:hypothetical protein